MLLQPAPQHLLNGNRLSDEVSVIWSGLSTSLFLTLFATQSNLGRFLVARPTD